MKMQKSFKNANQDVSYAGIRGQVWLRMLDMKVFKTISKDQCFPTVQDALAYQQPKGQTSLYIQNISERQPFEKKKFIGGNYV